MYHIPYNQPFITGDETGRILDAMASGHISGSGTYAQQCQDFFKARFGFEHCMLTSSCSQALEIIAQLCELNQGDEVIIPSFNYPTVASAFASRGATLVFADSERGRPHVSPEDIERKIGSRTKVIVVVHYGGQCCDMERIQKIARDHDLILVEDCAHAINVKCKDRYLGGFGHFSAFSFHETKNVHCGEGGMLVVNAPRFANRAGTIWREGTNRNDFEQGLVSKYEWVELGSSYQPSELNAAFLSAQLDQLDRITGLRTRVWNAYFEGLSGLASEEKILLPEPGPQHNAHIFYFACSDKTTRDRLLHHLNERGISAIFHYLPLHRSPFWLRDHKRESLPAAERWGDTILRLPLFIGLEDEQITSITEAVIDFYASSTNH